MLIYPTLSALLHPLHCSEADSSCQRARGFFCDSSSLGLSIDLFLPFLFCLFLPPTFSLKLVLGLCFSLSSLVNDDGDKGVGFLMRKECNMEEIVCV